MFTTCNSNTSTCGSVTDVLIERDSQWRICVGDSRVGVVNGQTNQNPTPWNKQLIQPRLVVLPYIKLAYVAFSWNNHNHNAASKAVVYASNSFFSGWTKEYESPAPTDGLLHDEWAPVLAAIDRPTESNRIGFSFRTTRFDASSLTKNELIKRVATRTFSGGTWDSPGGWPGTDGPGGPYPVNAWLGAYDGGYGAAWMDHVYQLAWGDPRDWTSMLPYTRVYGATIMP
jgi:hypothetical protein